MKLGIVGSIRAITIIPLLFLIVISSFVSFKTYKDFEPLQKLEKTIQLNNSIEKLYIELIKERGLSSGYLGSAGMINKDKLPKQREVVNEEINNVKDIIASKNILTSIEQNELFLLFKELEDVREKVNNLNITFNAMFFNFYSKLNDKLLVLLKSLEVKSTNAVVIINNINLQTVLSKIDEVSLERDFITKILAENIMLSKEDERYLEVLFNNSEFVKPSGLYNDKLIEDINQKYSLIKSIDEDLSMMKLSIIESLEDGEFEVPADVWYSKEQDKLNNLMAIRTLLKNNIVDEILTQQTTKKIEMVGFNAIGVLSLILIFISLGFANGLKGNIDNLSKLFRKLSVMAGHEEEVNLNTTAGQKEAYIVIEDSLVAIHESKLKAISANEAKSMFLANMSHEIRTPLNGIIGFANMLIEEELDETQMEFATTIVQSSENLLHIINDILDLSKIESNNIEIEEIPFSPVDQFEQAIETYGAKASEKHIDLSCYIDPSLSNVNLIGDPTRLREVVTNLMSNAIKFTPERGEVRVTIKEIGQTPSGQKTIYFEVQDTGIGIPKEKLGTIFSAFSQADSSTTREFGGTGLGLTISSKFIELMGASLDVSSEVGKGTKFFFQIDFDYELENSNKKIQNAVSSMSCAFLPSKEQKSQTKIMFEYMKFLGITTNVANSKSELDGLIKGEQINAVVIDYDYVRQCNKQEVEELVKIELPIFLIIRPKVKQQEKIFVDMENVKYIFEPINLSKLFKTFTNSKDKLKELNFLKARNTTVAGIEAKAKEININLNQSVGSKKEFTGKVLVAEDNTVNQKLIRKTLEKFSLEVDIVENGKEAFEYRKKGIYDLIFMDINMPIMTGDDATKEIIKWEQENGVPHIPVIAVTANALKDDRERFLEVGMDEYITKPIKNANIESAILKFIGEDEYNKFLKKVKG